MIKTCKEYFFNSAEYCLGNGWSIPKSVGIGILAACVTHITSKYATNFFCKVTNLKFVPQKLIQDHTAIYKELNHLDTMNRQPSLDIVAQRKTAFLKLMNAISSICIRAPIVEEIFFRSIYQQIIILSLVLPPKLSLPNHVVSPSMQTKLSAVAILIASGVFGYAHMEKNRDFSSNLITCLNAGMLGVVAGVLRQTSGNVIASIVAHATCNALASISVYYAAINENK